MCARRNQTLLPISVRPPQCYIDRAIICQCLRQNPRKMAFSKMKLIRNQKNLQNPTSCKFGNEKGLEYAEWYHGMLPRKDITVLLTRHGQFLVRETEIKKSEGMRLVLSVRWNDRTMHFIINEVAGKVCIKNHQFSSVSELVRYHMVTGEPITRESGASLLYVVPRQDWELKHEQIKLGELLGEGALAAVYRGTFTDNGQEKQVAVKVHKGRTLNRETIEQLCREARIMRRLEHPNVVRLYGIAISREPIMLLMELLKDGSLDMYLVTNSPRLTARDREFFCLDVAFGLEFLHKNGCIHRDVSSRNCLVQNMRVKITDFNLSREVKKQDENYKLVRMKQKLPIRWLSPETLKNAVYTTKSDVFSYGILLWEIFTDGAEPYSGMTVAEVNVNVKSGYRIPPPDTMPKRMQIVQQNCFTTDPTERWSMTQIRKEIEDICTKNQT